MKKKKERPESVKLHNEAINKNVQNKVAIIIIIIKKKAGRLPAMSPHPTSNHNMYMCDRRSV